jgi:hypothetical protein
MSNNKLKEYYEKREKLEKMKNEVEELGNLLKNSLGIGTFEENGYKATVWETQKFKYYDTAVDWLKEHKLNDCLKEVPDSKQIKVFIENKQIRSNQIKNIGEEQSVMAIKVTQADK